MVPSVGFVGNSNSGKTTLIVKIIKELKNRGYKVGIIKHHRHDSHFDQEGKDTYKHYAAGAERVVISGPNGVGIFEKTKVEKTLDELIELHSDMDIVIIEGYKRSNIPKIEVVRKEQSEVMICKENEIIALASNKRIEISKPTFDLDDYKAISDFIEMKFLS